MALGYCIVCQRLVAIRERGGVRCPDDPRSRQRRWFPAAHVNPKTGELCEGEGVEVQ